MKITILTIFPDIFSSFLHESIVGRAIQQSLLTVEAVDLRAFSTRKHRNTDDDPYGGGAGMVMLAQPIIDAMAHVAPCGADGVRRIFLSPRGKTLTQQKAMALSQEAHLVLLCGHYEGVDQRAIDLCIDEEISIGDYILTGGEVAALVLVDAVARLVPGVLGCAESALDESFTSGLLEYPHYTRPRSLHGLDVPEVLLGGNHADIAAWRRGQSLRVTMERRPELLKQVHLSEKEKQMIKTWKDLRLED